MLQQWLCCGPSWQSALLHVIIGGFCLLAVAVVICMCEWRLVSSMQTEIWPLLWRHKPTIKAKEL